MILIAAESPIGIALKFYHIKCEDNNILFKALGALGSVIHSHVLDKDVNKKWIELKGLSVTNGLTPTSSEVGRRVCLLRKKKGNRRIDFRIVCLLPLTSSTIFFRGITGRGA